MRTLVISDLHLGSRLGRDVLRRPEVLAVLLDALADVDRLVLLGDTVEMLEGRTPKAMAVAKPVLEALGDAVDEVVLVLGNHDHALVRPWLRERRDAGRGIGLASRIPHRAHPRLTQIAAWLKPARVEIRYPGVWLGDRTWATHGHYLDRHLLPPLSPDGHARAEDYEASGAGSVALLDLATATLPPVVGEPLDFGVQLAHRVASWWVPVAGALTGGALAPLSAGALGFQFRRAGLPAITRVVERLGVDADHVIFGHLHHGGQWPLGDGTLSNTGCWVYEPLLLAGATPPHPYWPGAAVVVEDDEPPRPVALLDAVTIK